MGISREERRRLLGLRKINPELFQVTEDMLRKKHLPDDFRPFDPGNFNAMNHNWNKEEFKLHSCMECGITIPGPKKLLLEHHKIHARKAKNDKRENEIITGRYLEYF